MAAVCMVTRITGTTRPPACLIRISTRRAVPTPAAFWPRPATTGSTSARATWPATGLARRRIAARFTSTRHHRRRRLRRRRAAAAPRLPSAGRAAMRTPASPTTTCNIAIRPRIAAGRRGRMRRARPRARSAAPAATSTNFARARVTTPETWKRIRARPMTSPRSPRSTSSCAIPASKSIRPCRT